MEPTKTKGGRQLAIFDGYTFVNERTDANGELSWQCINIHVCRARVKTDENWVISRRNGKHSHPIPERKQKFGKVGH